MGLSGPPWGVPSKLGLTHPLKIDFHIIVVTFINVLPCLFNRLAGASVRSESKAKWTKLFLEDRCKFLHDGLLDDPICYR
jgi:hypothetical protein